MDNLSGTPVQAAVSSSDRSSVSPTSPNKGGRCPILQLTPKSKQKRRRQQQNDSKKKARADHRAKLDSIPVLEKTIFDNLLHYQKEKDALGSEISAALALALALVLALALEDPPAPALHCSKAQPHCCSLPSHLHTAHLVV